VGEPIEFLGGFESTYQPAYDVDVAETTGHARRWRADLDLLAACGVRRLRYPVRWHRVEARRGELDWSGPDRVLGYMRDNGFRPVVDLLHFTSYPRWLRRGFADRRFADAYLRYAESFALRYPWVREYTLLNEPFTTFLLCGHEGVWPPYLRGTKGLLTLAANVLPAVAAVSRAYGDLLPGARHVYAETCERHTAATPDAAAAAAKANDRRFFLLDLFTGRPIDPERPFVRDVLAAGGAPLLTMEPGSIDVLALDYYAHSQWQYSGVDGRATSPTPDPAPLASLMAEYHRRYGLPCMLGETNIRGFASDRASWLKYTLEQCEAARDAGVPVDGYCWFPTVDSADWDSLLRRADGHLDPVGVFWLDATLERRPSSMSVAYARAAAGAPAADLPAYRFQSPVAGWLRGWMPHMAHWDWEDPPPAEVVSARR
jgi:beta-glucosidase/6-phospho-beta-glucosidase/beta-galactosidase